MKTLTETQRTASKVVAKGIMQSLNHSSDIFGSALWINPDQPRLSESDPGNETATMFGLVDKVAL
jgi:hypothetical protein